MECDIVRYENKIETYAKIHLQNLLGENNPEMFKTILEGVLVDKCDMGWNANLRELDESLRSCSSCSLLRKMGKNYLI